MIFQTQDLVLKFDYSFVQLGVCSGYYNTAYAKLPSDTSLERPRGGELRFRTADFWSLRKKSFEKKRSPIRALMGVYGSLNSWVTRCRHFGLNFWEKRHADWGSRKMRTSQLWVSKHVLFSRNKTRKIAYHMYGQVISCTCVLVHFARKLVSHANDRQFSGFYGSRTKHVWRMKVGMCAYFGIPIFFFFFSQKIRPKRRHLVTKFPKFLYTCITALTNYNFFFPCICPIGERCIVLKLFSWKLISFTRDVISFCYQK